MTVMAMNGGLVLVQLAGLAYFAAMAAVVWVFWSAFSRSR